MDEQINIDNKLDELSKLFLDSLSDKFTCVHNNFQMFEKKIPTLYGYKIEQERKEFIIDSFKAIKPLKWGFKGDTLVFNNTDTFNKNEYIVPDREAMDLVIQDSYSKFEAYVQATLAKMALLGWDAFLRPLSKNVQDFKLEYFWSVNEECISPKGSCVTHILLYPIIPAAKEKLKEGE